MSLWWVLLVASAVIEVGATLALPSTHGFTRLWPTVFAVAAYAVGIWLFSVSVAPGRVEVGPASAGWSGMVTGGVVCSAWALDAHRPTLLQVVCAVAVTLGVVGLAGAGTD